MAFPNYSLESKLYGMGYRLVAGVDEAGRGPLAGPVVGAAVILPQKTKIKGLDDSKKLSAKQRADVFARIQEAAVAISLGVAEINLISQVNILWASVFAMREATLSLNPLPDYVLVDGNVKLFCAILQDTIVGGDRRVASIAAASVVAKVARDQIMQRLDELYPKYGFCRHKGYGTKEHFAALKKFGPSPVHRVGWKSVSR